MRKFNHYKKELTLDSFATNQVIKRPNQSLDVFKIQEWLELNRLKYPALTSISIDGDFGKATESAIKEFQTFKNLPPTGEVNNATFQALTSPLRDAFEISNLNALNFRDALCKVAQIHKDNFSHELKYKKKNKSTLENNLGPWVRSYCDGADGEDYYWCCGFAKTIFDITCNIMGVDFSQHFVNSLSCDDAAKFALKKGLLIRNSELKNRIKEIKPGDVFFKHSPDNGSAWHHVGIIKEIDYSNGTFKTIEGNCSVAPTGSIDDTDNGVQVTCKTRYLFDKRQLTDSTGKSYWDYYEVYKLNI